MKIFRAKVQKAKKAVQIELLVILPECRDFDGMEVIVCRIHF